MLPGSAWEADKKKAALELGGAAYAVAVVGGVRNSPLNSIAKADIPPFQSVSL